MQSRRPLFPLVVLFLGLAACTQLGPAPTSTGVQGAAATQMPLPGFTYTYTDTSSTRGFWFEAPVAFRITGLRVPDETGYGLQNVEVFKLTTRPPEYDGTGSGGQVFYQTGVPSGTIIETDLTFAEGDFVGILGATGDASMMHNSYGNGSFTSSVLGEAVVLERFLTQNNIVATGGNQPYSSEVGGSIARVEVHVEALDTVAPTLTLTTPAEGAAYRQDEVVTVGYSCADEQGGSGLKSCTGTLADGTMLDTSTPGTYSFTVEAEDNAGNKASATHNYTVASAPPPAPERYTVDFEETPANRLLYSVKVGQDVRYEGKGVPNKNRIPVVGKRRLNSRILPGHQAKVVSLYGSKRLTVVKPNTNTPAPQGGRIKLGFAPNINPEGVTLTSLTLSNLTQPGAYLTLFYADGSSSRQTLDTTARGGSLVVPLDADAVTAVDIFAPTPFAVDDVTFTD